MIPRQKIIERLTKSSFIHLQNNLNNIQSQNFHNFNTFNNNLNSINSSTSINKLNGLSFQLRFRSRNARNSKDKKQPLLPEDNTRVYEYQPKIRPRTKHTPQRDVIFLQDTSIAFKGEIMRNAPKRMVQKYIRHQNKSLSPKAAFITEENKLQWAKEFSNLNQAELINKRMLKNFKTTLENMIITFKRQIPTRVRSPQFIVPITKDDICNRVWNLKKIILNPEDIQISTGAYNVIKHPGYWKCYYRCPDGEKVKMRLYCPTGARRSSIAGNSWEGFPYRT